MSDFKNRQEANVYNIADIDIYRNEINDKMYIIDSSQVMGALFIMSWIKEKKEKLKKIEKEKERQKQIER